MAEPDLPETVRSSALDADVRRDLRGLQKDTAEAVARHLVAAGLLVDDDPELSLQHARYARHRASRIAVVREAAGIAAYHAGEWNEALGEFRAARRMGGGPGHVPVMADIERALGRPERALDLTRGPEARDLGTAERIELQIVASGARRDLGELDAAVVGLQGPELDPALRNPWSARLFYAYADNLLAAGRESDAVQWFVHAHDADEAGETDAVARIAELTGEDLDGGDPDDGFTLDVEDVPAEVTADAADAVPESPRPPAGRDPAEEPPAPAVEQGTAGQDDVERDAAGRDDVERDAAGRDDVEQGTAGQDDVEQDDAGQDDAGQDDAGRDDVEQDAAGRDDVEQDTIEQDDVRLDPGGQDSAGRDAAEEDTVERDTAEEDVAGQDDSEQADSVAGTAPDVGDDRPKVGGTDRRGE